jgi:hypothetical protein
MIQLAEGARVTVNADAALNDYEAFRRGDRFYVKIPLAAFSFSQPRFHGNGFDDVQVQKVGDSVVVSFKLQLGASARVEQHANRLEVIFAAPNRGQSANLGSASAGVKDPKGSQGNRDRERDAAGPVPSDASQSSRQRYASAPEQLVNAAQRQPRRMRVEDSQGRNSGTHNQALATSAPPSAPSPTPVSSYPTASSYPPVASTPVGSSKPATVSTSSTSSRLRDWLSANRKASLLAALILAGLLAAAYLYRGRRTKFEAARTKRPLSQPKYQKEMDLEEMTESPAEREPVIAAATPEATKSPWRSTTPRPAFAPAAEVAATPASVFSKASNNSVVVADDKVGGEEREVFEL